MKLKRLSIIGDHLLRSLDEEKFNESRHDSSANFLHSAETAWAKSFSERDSGKNPREEKRMNTPKHKPTKLKGVIPGFDTGGEFINAPLVIYVDPEGLVTDSSDKREGVTRHVIGEAVIRGEELHLSLSDRELSNSVLDAVLKYPSDVSFGLDFSEVNEIIYNPSIIVREEDMDG